MFRKISSIMALSDAILLAGVLAAAFLFKFGLLEDSVSMKNPGLLRFAIPTILQPVYIYLIWLVSLMVLKSRDQRVLGSDTQEYKRVVMAGLAAPAFFAVASLIFKVDVSRGYLLATVALGNIALLANRWFWRKWLVKQRIRGNMLSKVALLGPKDQIEKFASKLIANPADGFSPALLVVDSQNDFPASNNFEVLPRVVFSPNMARTIQNHGCSTVMVIGSQIISDIQVKSLAWEIEGSRIELIVVPPIKDISVSRLALKPIAGSVVFTVEVPQLSTIKNASKRLFDVCFSALALTIVSPLMLLVAIAIKVEDGGPVFFAHERFGRNGKTFKMLKFRSMHLGAEKLFETLKNSVTHDGNEVQFKLKSDPRITRVGKFIRKYSIDELPQFVNVFQGTMSVVGPRPHVLSEVDAYADEAHRRHLVKPGVTGLWQVSGRSNLSWDESIALDLNYVENWSLVGDLLLIARTIKTILVPEGAY
jgi:exopolysaccharide biosynthesis polyprenyl glycosylphosphotransferase